MITLDKDEIQSSKFYFLSDKSNLTRIYPRVPKRRMIYEDSKTKRICCVKRIYSALKAIPIHNGMDLYIYAEHVMTHESNKVSHEELYEKPGGIYRKEWRVDENGQEYSQKFQIAESRMNYGV